MSGRSKKEMPSPSRRPFYLTGLGIAIVTLLTCGLALPFLLWARGPQTRERRRKIILWTTAVVVVSLVGSALDQSSNDVSSTSDADDPTVEEIKKDTMPNVTGISLDLAREQLENLDVDVVTEEQDLISERGVWDDSNWVVVNQSPGSGTRLSDNQMVCLGIVKSDETWETPDRLQCWENAKEELVEIGDNYEMTSKGLMRVFNLPTSLEGRHLRAEVKIELDRGNTLYLPFCTYAPVGNASTNLKLDPSNGGDPGAFANGGQSFEAGLYLEWTGRYRYSIHRLEKSETSRCVG